MSEEMKLSELGKRLRENWLHIGEFFASRNWPDTALGNAARELNADIPRIVAALAAPAHADEPVAWLISGNYTRCAFAYQASAEAYCKGLLTTDPDGGYTIIPLYAHPSAGIRSEAIESCAKVCDAEMAGYTGPDLYSENARLAIKSVAKAIRALGESS